MRSLLAVLAIGCFFVAPASAQEVDKEKLRQALKMPDLPIQWEVGVSGHTITIPSEVYNLKGEILKVQKSIQTDPSNADNHQRLSRLLYQNGEKEAWEPPSAKAIALYRSRLQQQPKDAKQWMKLGAALAWTEKYEAEADEALIKSVQLAPDDWECWSELAERMFRKCVAVLQSKGPSKSEFMPGITAEDGQKAKAYFDQAVQYHDQAVALASKSGLPYLGRATFRGAANKLLQQPLAAPLKDAKTPDEQTMQALMLADFYKAAELEPDNPLLAGTAANVHIMVLLSRLPQPVDDTKMAIFDQFSEKDRQCLLPLLQRMDQLTVHSNPAVANQAKEFLGFLYIHLREFARASKTWSALVQSDPSRDIVWDLLAYVHLQKDSHEAGLRVLQDWLKVKQSPHLYFRFASAYAAQQDWDKADEALARGLKLDESDLYCCLSKAIMLLKRDHDAKDRAVVDALLQRCIKHMSPTMANDTKRELAIGVVAYHAMYGEIDEQRQNLNNLKTAFPKDERILALAKIIDAVPPKPPVPPNAPAINKQWSRRQLRLQSF